MRRFLTVVLAFCAALLTYACTSSLGEDHAGSVSASVPAGATVGLDGDPDAEWLETIAAIEPVVGGLPDLISEPPLARAVNVLEYAGTPIRVVQFDGHVTNIGPGVLDIFGDPHLSDSSDPTSHDVWQRVWNGDGWEQLAQPPVRFEAADGHNHFHLMQIARYSMWDGDQQFEVAPGEKIGFCLFDSEPIEDGAITPAYVINDGWFCRQGAPLADRVRMGISPGWRDIYPFTLALQWIDVSNVLPGNYWLANESDPFEQIVEASEDNNGLVFSAEPFQLPGYLALPDGVLAEDGTATTFELPAFVIGIPEADPRFVVEELPSNGTIVDVDGNVVAVGDELADPNLTWQPVDGAGISTLVFSVRTHESQFPWHPLEGRIVLATESAIESEAPGPAIGGARRVLLPGQRLTLFVAGDEPATWRIAQDTTGLATIDADGNLITGSADGSITIEANVGGRTSTVTIEVATPENQAPYIGDPVVYEAEDDEIFTSAEPVETNEVVLDMPSVLLLPVVDRDGDILELTVSGLPDGLSFDRESLVISGTPETAGEYTPVARATDGTVETVHEFVLNVIEG